MTLAIMDYLDENWVMPTALILFILTYICLLFFSKKRAYVALGSALIFLILGYLPFTEIPGAIDWNVIMMIAGTMGIVSLFIESKMPALIADKIIDRASDMRMAILALSLFSGLISAFIDNVATVLMIAPIAITIAKKLKVSPVPSIIAIAIASNLEGAATLVGDTTSILLGGYLDMTFFDFFFYHGKIGLFFIVQAGLLAATGVLWFVFRHRRESVEIEEKTTVTDYFPTYLMLAIIVCLIIASFIPNTPRTINGLICMALLVIGLIYRLFQTKSIQSWKTTLGEIDYKTLFLLGGLFLIIRSITNAGVIDAMAQALAHISGGNVFIIYTILVFASVLLSAFIDNIPYVATMLTVVAGLQATLGLHDPTVLYFGLLVGATLGGNLTPIGASANITAIAILQREGHDVKPWTFMKIGIPYTLAAVMTGYVLVWLIYT
ncbi:MAG: SLC13 family permease [Candidatus Izemoplasmatales bacterium]